MSWCREAAALAACLTAASAAAAEWSLGGSGEGRVEHLSNPRFAAAPSPVTRSSLSAGLGVAARAEAWDASLDARYRHYLEAEPDISDEESVAGRATRRFERSTLALAGSWARGSTTANDADPAVLVATSVPRETWSLAPSWQVALTQQWTASAGASFGAIRYARRAPGLADSDSGSANVGATYAVAERTSLGATAVASKTDTDPFSSRSETVSLQGTASHSFSERWSASASYGPSRTLTDTAAFALVCPVEQVFCELGLVPFVVSPATISRTVRGNTWSLSGSYQAAQHTTLSFAADRSVSAPGGGAATDNLTASLRLSHRLTDRLLAGAEANERHSQPPADERGEAARTRTRSASASLTWQLAERWSLDGGVSFQQSRLPTGPEAHSETVFVALRYAPERRLLR